MLKFRILPALLFPVLLLPALRAQRVGSSADTNAGTLRRHYDAAQAFQHDGRLDQAAQQYRLFIADALGELAIDRAHLRQYPQAAPLFDEALALAPHSPALQVEYAQAALFAGDSDRARDLARQILAQYPGNTHALARAHFVLGRLAFRQNQPRNARAQLEAAVALDPTFPNGYSLAVACLELEDRACAVQLFSEMEKSFGDTPALHMDYGRAYGQSDFQPDAVAEFRKVLAEDPRFPGAHYALAAALLAANGDTDQAEAEAELKKEVQISPDNGPAWAALGHIAALDHRTAEARQDLARAAQLDPSDPDVFLYLGQIDYEAGQKAQAESALRQSIRLTTDPSRNRYQVGKAHYLLGRILYAEGHAREAQAEMQTSQQLAKSALIRDQSRMVDFIDKNLGATTSAADTPQAASPSAAPPVDPAAVRAADDFAKKIAGPVADSYNNLGAIAATAKDYVTASTWFQRAAEWNSALPGLDENWGRAAFYAGRFGDAIPPLARLVAGRPGDQHLRAALGISQFMTGDYAACIQTLDPMKAQLSAIPAADRVYKAALQKVSANK